MCKGLKKPIAWFLAILLVFSSLPGLMLTVAAEEAVPAVESVSLLVTDDTYIRPDNKSTNFNTETKLFVRGNNVNSSMYSYLKFDLSTIPDNQNITKATLVVYCKNYIPSTGGPTKSDIGVFRLENESYDSWTEDTLVWGDDPDAPHIDLGPKLAEYLDLDADNYQNVRCEFDVTEYVCSQYYGDKYVTLVLAALDKNNVQVGFYNKEGGWSGSGTDRRPMLEIQYSNQVGTPYPSIAPGTYNNALSIELSTSTQGATIYYTDDNSEPTTDSILYEGPIAITTSKTIKAIAVKEGLVNSGIAELAYVLEAAEPVASPEAGIYYEAQSVTLASVTEGAVIHYTLDGSDPDENSPVFGGPINVSESVTIKAIAMKEGMKDSSIAVFNYTLPQQVPAPIANPVPGTYSSPQNVVLNCSLEDATIYYTTDGTVPSDQSTVYNGPIPVAANTIIKAIAVREGMGSSPVSTFEYRIKVAAPVASPGSGEYTEEQQVALTCATEGASIYYTTDGTQPTGASQLYTAPITVNSLTVIKAVAVKPGMEDSEVVQFNYCYGDKVEINIKPVEDTHINRYTPDLVGQTVDGSATHAKLRVRDANGGKCISFIKYNLSDEVLRSLGQPTLQGTLIGSVKLSLYLRNVPAASDPNKSTIIRVYTVPDDNWSEATLSWNTAHALGYVNSSDSSVPPVYNGTALTDAVIIENGTAVGTRVTFDIPVDWFLSQLGEDKIISLAVASEDNLNLDYSFYSKEDSNFGNTRFASLDLAIYSPLPAPTGFTAKRSDKRVELKWNSVDGAEWYVVNRGNESGEYDQSWVVHDLSYMDTTVVNGTTYYYTVTPYSNAVADGGQPSNEISITPGIPPAPSVPRNLYGQPGDGEVTVSWSAVTPDDSYIEPLKGYKVYRSSSEGGPYSHIATVEDTTYTDDDVENYITYYYTVSAYNDFHESDKSEEIYIMPRQESAFSGLEALTGDAQVALTWPATGEGNYTVKRIKVGDTETETLASGLTEEEYLDTTAVNGEVYYYFVEAAGVGRSNMVLATPTAAKTNIAIGKTATASSIESTNMLPENALDGNRTTTRWSSAWDQLPVDVRNNNWYQVDLGSERSIGTVIIVFNAAYGKDYDILASSNGTDWTTVYQMRNGTYIMGDNQAGVHLLPLDRQITARYLKFQGITCGSQYGYSFYEFEVYTEILHNDPVTYIPEPPADAAFKNVVPGNRQVYMSWYKSHAATSYKLYRKAPGEADFTLLKEGIKAQAYWDYPLENGQTYQYKLEAVNNHGSAMSELITVVPYEQENEYLNYVPEDYYTDEDGYLGIYFDGRWRPFSADSPWNTPIEENPPIDPNSDAIINTIKTVTESSNVKTFKITYSEWAIPIHFINSDKVTPVNLTTTNSFDILDTDLDTKPDVTIPFPVAAWAEQTEDGHLVVIDPVKKLAWEASRYYTTPDENNPDRNAGNPTCTTLNVWDLTGSGTGIAFDGARWGARGSRASGTPGFAGVIRFDEMVAGEINHALAWSFSQNRTGDDGQNWFAYPAARSDAKHIGPQYPYEGARLQLDPTLPESYFRDLGISDEGMIVVRALQKYGMYNTDIAGNFRILAQPLSPDTEESNRLWEEAFPNLYDDITKIPIDKFRVIESPKIFKTPDFVTAPSARLMSGTYNGPQTIVLDAITVGSEIYYTTDGSTPTRNSTKYTGPFKINSDTTIKAFAVKDGMEDSIVMTFNYSIIPGEDGEEMPTPTPGETPSPSPSPSPSPTPAPTTRPVENTAGTPAYNVVVSGGSIAGAKLPVEVAKDTGNAVIDLSTLAEDILESAEAPVLMVPSIPGVNSYALEIPAAVLSGSQKEDALTLATDAGSITIPANMLAVVPDAEGKKADITIGKADTSSLTEEIKAAIGQRPVIQITLALDGVKTEWSNPDAPVKVSIPYTPTEEELADPEHIVVWYIDGNGNVIPVPNGRYDAAAGTVTFYTTHFSHYAVAYVHRTFNDLGSVEWARKAIEVMASKGIINGTGKDTFSSTASITRADYLVLLVRTLGLTAEFEDNFEDVEAGTYYYDAIGIAKKLGIAAGSGNNRFNPKESISRQDMMVLTARALEKFRGMKVEDTEGQLDRFTDKGEISGYAVSSLATLVREGLITGSGDKLNPRANTTRAEAAVFLYRIYNRH